MSKRKRKHQPYAPNPKHVAHPSTSERAPTATYIPKSLVLAVIAMMAIGLWYARTSTPSSGHARPSRTREPHAHAVIDPPVVDMEALVTRSLELKPEVSMRLHAVADEIPEVAPLVEFFDSHAIPAIASPLGGLLTVGGTDSTARIINAFDGPDFLILEATLEERLAAGLNVRAFWQYSGGSDALFAHPGLAEGGIFPAAVYLHELQHAYDVNLGIEPSPPSESEWYDGEIRAYRTEIAVLDHHTDGRFSACVREESERYPNDTFLTTSYLPRLPPCLNPLLGASTSEAETTARAGLVYVMIDLLVAEHRGGSQEDLREAIAHASPFR